MRTINIDELNKIGAMVFLIGLIFAIAETIYFGSNWLPQSKAEVTCDFIASWLIGAGESLMMLWVLVVIFGKKLSS